MTIATVFLEGETSYVEYVERVTKLTDRDLNCTTDYSQLHLLRRNWI